MPMEAKNAETLNTRDRPDIWPWYNPDTGFGLSYSVDLISGIARY